MDRSLVQLVQSTAILLLNRSPAFEAIYHAAETNPLNSLQLLTKLGEITRGSLQEEPQASFVAHSPPPKSEHKVSSGAIPGPIPASSRYNLSEALLQLRKVNQSRLRRTSRATQTIIRNPNSSS